MNDGEELDYILQVISNKLRRDIIRLIAEEGPISYTKLMKKTGVEDSGTFGFHIKKMRKLLKKNDLGEYILNDTGLKAYKLIKDLEQKKKTEERKEKSEEDEEIVISDKLSFEFDEAFARKLYEDGKKVIFTDIVTFTIYPMPPEIFDSVVKEISDCVTIYVPKEIENNLHLKANDVLTIKSYEGEKPRRKGYRMFLDLGFLPSLLSNVMEGVFSALSKVDLTNSFNKVKKEIYLENELDYVNNANLEISLSGGVLEITEGEKGYVRVWKTGSREPDIDIIHNDSTVKIEGENGYFEFILPANHTEKLHIDLNGGVTKVRMMNLSENIVELSGGYVIEELESSKPLYSKININEGGVKSNIKLSKYLGDAKVEIDMDGGVCRNIIEVESDTRVLVKSSKLGGISKIKLDKKDVSGDYMDEDFKDSSSKLYILSELKGGVSFIDIKREKRNE